MAAVANAEVIKRLRILIADSKTYSRALLRSILWHLEIKSVHEATDGVAALHAIDVFSPDIMILDWELPFLGAREVLHLTRSSLSTNPDIDLPIIVLSSLGRSEYVRQAKQLGIPHFVLWPISPKMVEQRLLKIVTDARKTALASKLSDQPAPTPDPWIIAA